MATLTFIIGTAANVFADALARAVETTLRERYPPLLSDDVPYESEPLPATGWRALQQRVLRTLDVAPQITSVDAYQAVYVPWPAAGVEHLVVPNAADPLQVGSVPALLEELKRFAAAVSLPTDDLELMRLAGNYLEAEDPNADLDVQTYVQLMLTAKQAMARGQALWVVV